MTADFEVLGAGHHSLEPASDPAVASGQVAAAEVPADQEGTRSRLLDLIDHHDRAADRTCRPGHLTGSGLVVDPSRAAALLMLHRKLGRWFQPGGHADGNTNLAAVALREATEETGIGGLVVLAPAFDLDVHRVEPPDEDAHLHFDVRHLVLAPQGAVERPNHESRALRWIAADQLDDLDPAVDPSTRRLVIRGLELLG